MPGPDERKNLAGRPVGQLQPTSDGLRPCYWLGQGQRDRVGEVK